MLVFPHCPRGVSSNVSSRCLSVYCVYRQARHLWNVCSPRAASLSAHTEQGCRTRCWKAWCFSSVMRNNSSENLFGDWLRWYCIAWLLAFFGCVNIIKKPEGMWLKISIFLSVVALALMPCRFVLGLDGTGLANITGWLLWVPIREMIPGAHSSPYSKWYLDRFSHFSTAHSCDHKQTHTDHATSVTSMHRTMWYSLKIGNV